MLFSFSAVLFPNLQICVSVAQADINIESGPDNHFATPLAMALERCGSKSSSCAGGHHGRYFITRRTHRIRRRAQVCSCVLGWVQRMSFAPTERVPPS